MNAINRDGSMSTVHSSGFVSLHNLDFDDNKVIAKNDNGVQIHSNNGIGINILDNGNVGIGITNPNEKLVVSGNIIGTNLVVDKIKTNGNILKATTTDGLEIRNFVGKGITLTNTSKVGIGITNPTNELSVSGSVSASNFKTSTFSGDVLFLSTNTTDGPRISKGVEGSWYNEYKAGKKTDATIGQHIFYTGDGTNWAERVRIDNTGRLGVNKSNPAYKLDVVGDINYSGYLRKSGTIQQLGSNWNLHGTKLYYNTDNVGIGTNNPLAKLTVNSTIGNLATFKNTDDNDWAYISIGNNTTATGGGGGFMLGYDNQNNALVRNLYASDIKVSAGNIERMRIKGSSYRVGIGTDNPSLDGLHIHNPSTTASHYANLLLTTNATGTSSSGLSLEINDIETALRNYENTPLKFAVNGLDKLIIASNGKVGIGTSTINRNLELVGDFLIKKGTRAILFEPKSSGDESNSIWINESYDPANSGAGWLKAFQLRGVNVGFGALPSASHRVHIQGNLNFTGNLTKNGVVYGDSGDSGTIKKVHILTDGSGGSSNIVATSSAGDYVSKDFTKNSGTNILVKLSTSYTISGNGGDGAFVGLKLVNGSDTESSPTYRIYFDPSGGGGGRSADMNGISFYCSTSTCQGWSGTTSVKIVLPAFTETFNIKYVLYEVIEINP